MGTAICASGSSSNILNSKLNTPEYRSVADFVSQSGPCDFILDGQRGEKKSQLCRLPRGGPGAAVHSTVDGSQRSLECTEIAIEAKDLFATMQSLNFFCQLPQDPSKTHIHCQKIPQ
ncbi:unnamed protein product [Parajaminaea phylloscopi]